MCFKIPNFSNPKAQEKLQKQFNFIMLPIQYEGGTETTVFQKFNFFVDHLFYLGERKLSIIREEEQTHPNNKNRRIQKLAVHGENQAGNAFFRTCKLLIWLATLIGIIALPQYRNKIIATIFILACAKVITKTFILNGYLLENASPLQMQRSENSRNNSENSNQIATQPTSSILSSTAPSTQANRTMLIKSEEYTQIKEPEQYNIKPHPTEAFCSRLEKKYRSFISEREKELEEEVVNRYYEKIKETLHEKMKDNTAPQIIIRNTFQQAEKSVSNIDLRSWIKALEQCKRLDLSKYKVRPTLFKDILTEKIKEATKKEEENSKETLFRICGIEENEIKQWLANQLNKKEDPNVEAAFKQKVEDLIHNAQTFSELTAVLYQLEKAQKFMTLLQIDSTRLDELLFNPKKQDSDHLVHKKALDFYQNTFCNQNLENKTQTDNEWHSFMTQSILLLKKLQNISELVDLSISTEELVYVISKITQATQLTLGQEYSKKMFFQLIRNHILTLLAVNSKIKEKDSRSPSLPYKVGDLFLIKWIAEKFEALNSSLQVDLKVENNSAHDEEVARSLYEKLNPALNHPSSESSEQPSQNLELVIEETVQMLLDVDQEMALDALLKMDEPHRKAYLKVARLETLNNLFKKLYS